MGTSANINGHGKLICSDPYKIITIIQSVGGSLEKLISFYNSVIFP